MGREWYWGGRSSTKTGSGGGGERDSSATPSGCMSAVLQLFDFHPFHFALHQQPSLKPDSLLPEEPPVLKGVEAPRNSLESEEPVIEAASLSSIIEEEESFSIRMGIQIKTSGDAARSKVEGSKARADDLSSESSSSPGTKTPNLVARLMGLDLLPESSTPSISANHGASIPLRKSQFHHLQAKKGNREFRSRPPLQIRPNGYRSFHDNDTAGTRSLPETPRISSARRSDVDHRLSLQINRENISFSEELFARCSSKLAGGRSELKQEDDRSPGHYARQIVKQVKESVSRRVGLDITNTIRNRDQRGEELARPIKMRKSSKILTIVSNEKNPSKHSSAPSCSPRLRFLEPRNKPVIASSTKDQTFHPPPPKQLSSISSTFVNNSSQPTKGTPKPKSQSFHDQQQKQQKSVHRCEKATEDRFGSRRLKKPPQTSDAIRNKQEEQFVRPSTTPRASNSDRKCKKTPLSNKLVNPTFVPFKKDHSHPAPKIPQEQIQTHVSDDSQPPKRTSPLPSCPGQSYKEEATHELANQEAYRDRSKGATTASDGGAAAAEIQYITRILKCTGIDRGTPVSLSRWFSAPHPLNSSIFHHLEHSFIPTATTSSTSAAAAVLGNPELNHKCNRKLIFDLVDEILGDILKPRSGKSQTGQTMHGHQLLEILCRRIGGFPLADCRVLEDIDALIDGDLTGSKVQSWEAYEEEGEGIALEIEKDIMNSLVQETAADFGGPVPYGDRGATVWQGAAEADTPSHVSLT
ncbi:uncharacterized protein LOC131146481 [Malania oleifera]|uniref:uncharacterized protein LOC131146481 n=1 Tax=Malania oleifera TaxID=397392 RepID=UPI0025ADEA7F|nr:uncharacterized protein LOC131146481 [Malania oleifera]